MKGKQKQFEVYYQHLLAKHGKAVTHKLIFKGVRIGTYPAVYAELLGEASRNDRNEKNRTKTEMNLKIARNRFRNNIKLKNFILDRDNRTCRACGSRDWPEVDHIKPLRFFPWLIFEVSNLQVLCRKCNRKKHAKH